MAKKKKQTVCPHCFVDFKELTTEQCKTCGRVSDGDRWCCLSRGKTFSARKLGGGFLPFCPVCKVRKWTEGMFSDIPYSLPDNKEMK